MMGACHCVYGYFAGPTVTVVIESLTSSKVSRRLSVLQTTMEFEPTCSKGATAPAIPCILVRLMNTCWFVVIFECHSSQTVDQPNGTSFMCTGDMFILLLLHPNIHRKTS